MYLADSSSLSAPRTGSSTLDILWIGWLLSTFSPKSKKQPLSYMTSRTIAAKVHSPGLITILSASRDSERTRRRSRSLKSRFRSPTRSRREGNLKKKQMFWIWWWAWIEAESRMHYLHPIKLVVHYLPPQSPLGMFVQQWNTWLQVIGPILLLQNFHFGFFILGSSREESTKLAIVFDRFLPWFLLLHQILKVFIFLWNLSWLLAKSLQVKTIPVFSPKESRISNLRQSSTYLERKTPDPKVSSPMTATTLAADTPLSLSASRTWSSPRTNRIVSIVYHDRTLDNTFSKGSRASSLTFGINVIRSG